MTVTTARDRRRALGLNATQLADLAGVSRATVQNYERDAHVSGLNVARIEQALEAAEAERAGVAAAHTVLGRLDAVERAVSALTGSAATAASVAALDARVSALESEWSRIGPRLLQAARSLEDAVLGADETVRTGRAVRRAREAKAR